MRYIQFINISCSTLQQFMQIVVTIWSPRFLEIALAMALSQNFRKNLAKDSNVKKAGTVRDSACLHDLSPNLQRMNNSFAMSDKRLAESAHCIPKVLCKGSPFHGPSARLVSTLTSLILYIISSPAVFAVGLCLSRFSVVWEALFRNTCDKQQKPQRFQLVAACLNDNLELLFVHHMIQIHHFKTVIQAISWANYRDLHEFRS